MYMNIVLGVLVGLIVLMVLITGHEFGHFIMARRNGVTVKEFGIGFPPRAIAWTKGADGKWHKIPRKNWNKARKSLIFSLNWLPIGGFCQMDGESDADERPGTFGSVSLWKKTKILFGGVLMNWLMAFVILTFLAAIGMPKFIDNQFTIAGDTYIDAKPITVDTVAENSPAEKAGIKSGDKIAQVVDVSADVNNTTDIGEFADLTEFNNSHAGQEVGYVVERDGEKKLLTTTLNSADNSYLLGVSVSQTGLSTYRSTWSAPIVGAVVTVQLTGETFRGFGTIIYNFVSGTLNQFSGDESTREQGRTQIGQAGDSFTGPVGILGTLFPSFVSTGFTNTLFLAALISVSLACMNVLPIPALDGGRFLLIVIYRLRGKKLDQETEARIVSRAFLVLFAMIILITILDITRLFR